MENEWGDEPGSSGPYEPDAETLEEWRIAEVNARTNEFGRCVRELRRARGLSQAELAARMSALGAIVHQTQVAKTESGSRPTPVTEVWAIATVLGVSYDDLLPVVVPSLDNLAAAVREVEWARRRLNSAHDQYAREREALHAAQRRLDEVRKESR